MQKYTSETSGWDTNQLVHNQYPVVEEIDKVITEIYIIFQLNLFREPNMCILSSCIETNKIKKNAIYIDIRQNNTMRQAAVSVKISNFLICFCSF